MDLPAVLFNAAEARTIRESYAESNERFTKRYFGNAKPHLGGRRYSDEERDQIRERINQPEFTDRFLEMRRIRQSNDVLEGDKA